MARLTPTPFSRALCALALACAPAAFAVSKGVSAVALLVAQADDPYGVGAPSGAAPVDTPAPVDTSRPPVSNPPVDAPAVVPPAPPVPVVADTAPRAPRPRVTRETTINPMDVRRGEYRNPKKALFMSLVVPGLGQAYVGGSAFTYARAGAYFGTELVLGYLWYDYSVVKYDRQVKSFRRYADTHWSQEVYENGVAGYTEEAALFGRYHPERASYCATVQRQEGAGQALYDGCVTPLAGDGKYDNFRTTFEGEAAEDAAARAARRAGLPDPVTFYAMVGSNQEFIFGWDDALGAAHGGDTTVLGTSAHRDRYNAMRQQAKDYSRMQAWFLGGIVLNHIASAVDAALTARRHNRVLYEQSTGLLDRLNFDGGMAFDVGRPRTYLSASLSF